MNALRSCEPAVASPSTRSFHSAAQSCAFSSASPAVTTSPAAGAAASSASATARAAAAALPGESLPAGWVRCFVAIGTNAGHRARNIHAALALLQQLDPLHLQLHATSCLYESTPVGSPPEHAAQPRFLNAAIELRTNLTPLQLLDRVKEVEQRLGRDFAVVRNGPRVIDLDIIMYDSPSFTFSHERLQVPHPRWHSRGFVLWPLRDLLSSASESQNDEQRTWTTVVQDASTRWTTAQRAAAAKGADNPDIEHLHRVIAFPSADCVPGSPSPALSDVWRWGPPICEASAAASPFPPTSSAPTILMAILNLTPDSFSDGGVALSHGVEGAVARAKALWDAGADIIDIGGESTRPGSTAVSAEEELARIAPVISAIHARYPKIKLSVDTYHPSVAREAVRLGCVMINDVYGGTYREASGRESMLDVAAELNVPYVCMHMRGTAQDMTHKQRQVYTDIVRNVCEEQEAQFRAALRTRAPVSSSALDSYPSSRSSLPASATAAEAVEAATSPLYRFNLIADPGIGFAKDGGHSLQLLNDLPHAHPADFPLLVGSSRKGFISRILAHGQTRIQLRQQASPEGAAASSSSSVPAATAAAAVSPTEREWGTGATVVASILGGAHIVRIHDVAAMRCIRDVADSICRR